MRKDRTFDDSMSNAISRQQIKFTQPGGSNCSQGYCGHRAQPYIELLDPESSAGRMIDGSLSRRGVPSVLMPLVITNGELGPQGSFPLFGQGEDHGIPTISKEFPWYLGCDIPYW